MSRLSNLSRRSSGEAIECRYGRRERAKQDERERIMAAARELVCWADTLPDGLLRFVRSPTPAAGNPADTLRPTIV
jgi:hypothetical protein